MNFILFYGKVLQSVLEKDKKNPIYIQWFGPSNRTRGACPGAGPAGSLRPLCEGQEEESCQNNTSLKKSAPTMALRLFLLRDTCCPPKPGPAPCDRQ